MRGLQRWRERRLRQRLRRGDRAAAERLADGHYESAYRWLLHLCGDRELAADLTQETFLQVWRGLDGFEGRSSLKTWIHRIAYTTYLRARERALPQTAPLAEAAQTPGPSGAVINRCALEDALRQLPPQQRETVLLHYLQGLKIREIAEVLEIPEGTVLSRLHHARLRLREALSDEEPVPHEEVRTDVATK